MSIPFEIRQILRSVKKSFRYIGGEVGSRVRDWDNADFRLCLVFPDVYEIGTSHIGLSILYHIINDQPNMLAERAFAPWLDMEREFESHGVPLFSLESRRPLADFDVVGVSLAYELTYTNVLTVLKLGGIPLRASDRDETHPLVIAGGPCAFNPEPVAPFFDAVAIGDGEGLVVRIADVVMESKRGGLRRSDILERLRGVRGVYVPSLDENGRGIGRAVVSDLERAPYPAFPVVPYATTQMRLAVEAARGCTRGCRFCQAGYIYRPLRQRTGETAARLACDGIRLTGQDDFSFLSLSIGDWQPLEGALLGVHRRCEEIPVNASLPSLRVESLTDGIIGVLGRARFGSFTLAPEAGTERMRRFINKGNTDGDLYASVERIFTSGWHAIKLYFMLGLPGETEDEIEGVVNVANRCLDIGRRYHRRPDITVSTSIFVPKAHTPFQWDAQISIGRAKELQGALKRRLRRPGMNYRWHGAEQSFLEGVFSRGGRELADVIEMAHRNGARFDGWDECFNFEAWQNAFAWCGIDPNLYLGTRDHDYKFPWEHLCVGPSREFLLNERKKADGLLPTPDCSSGSCPGCGICDFDEVKNRLAPEDTRQPSTVGIQLSADSRSLTADSHHQSTVDGRRSTVVDCHRYRLQYRKEGTSAFLGGLETLDALRFGLRSSGLPLCYSGGYHPRVKVGFGPALPVGVESEAEFADIELSSPVDADEIVKRLDGRLPRGMAVASARPLEPASPSIDESIASQAFVADLSDVRADTHAAIAGFKAAPTFPFKRMRGKGAKEVDLKRAIAGLAVLRDGVLRVTILNEPPVIRATEALQGIFGISDDAMNSVTVRKIDVEWKKSAES